MASHPRVLYGTLWLLAFLARADGQAEEPVPEAPLAPALALLHQGHPRQALPLFDAFIAAHPDSATAFLQRGRAQAHLRNLAHARADFAEAIRLQPSFPGPWYERAEVLESLVNRELSSPQRGELLEAAIADYTEAIRLHPAYPEALRGRGYSHWSRGEWKEAKADFTRAIELRPKFALAFFYRARVRAILEDSAGALADYETALGFQPKQAEWIYQRGCLYRDLGQKNQALAAFTEAMTADSKYQRAWNDRASLYSERGQYDLAIADLTEAIRLQPTLPFFRRNRAINLENQGKYPEALADLAEATRLSPKTTEYTYLRARIEARQGRKEEALRDLEAAGNFYPNAADWHYARGWVLARLKEPWLAMLEFDETLGEDPQHAKALAERSTMWRELGRLPEALQDQDQAIQLSPNDPIFHHNRGQVLFDLGRYEESAAAHARAVALNPHYSGSIFREFLASAVHGQAQEGPRKLAEYISQQGWRSREALYFTLTVLLTLEKAGDTPRAQTLAEQALAATEPSQWPCPILRYFAGTLDEAALLGQSHTPDELTETHAYLGLQSYYRGNQPRAQPHLDWVCEHGVKSFDEYHWVLALPGMKAVPQGERNQAKIHD